MTHDHLWGVLCHDSNRLGALRLFSCHMHTDTGKVMVVHVSAEEVPLLCISGEFNIREFGLISQKTVLNHTQLNPNASKSCCQKVHFWASAAGTGKLAQGLFHEQGVGVTGEVGADPGSMPGKWAGRTGSSRSCRSYPLFWRLPCALYHFRRMPPKCLMTYDQEDPWCNVLLIPGRLPNPPLLICFHWPSCML